MKVGLAVLVPSIWLRQSQPASSGRYYPFGETRLSTSTLYTDKLFTGQRNMAGLGIYHYGARFYSPKLGRFLSADTIVPNPANPQALNRYSYVFGNPLRFTDPSGHRPCGDGEAIECDGKKNTPQATKPIECGGKGQRPCGSDKPNRPSPEQKVRNEINQQFDPFIGTYPDFVYEGSNIETANLLANEAYGLSGYDLQAIAQFGINNPMTDDDWLATGVPIEYIYSRGGLASHGPYRYFLDEMNLDQTYHNLEPNYLNAMMEAHPRELANAKENYYQDLIALHGSPESFLEWLEISKELIGPDIPPD